MRLSQFGDQQINLLVQITAVLRRTRDDQRRARLINQDAVHLVHDGKVVPPLRHFFQTAFHVVAQIVKAQLVVGGMGDIGPIRGALFIIRLERVNHPHRHTQRVVNLAHPVGIALGQIVVDRHDVHTLAGQRIQIGRQRGGQGLALARAHFRNVAAMQENPTHQLHIKRPQAQRPLGGFTAIGKGLWQYGFQAFATLLHTLLQLGGLGLDVLVAQCGKLRFQSVDLCDQRTHHLDHTVIRRPKDFPC